MTAGKMTGWRNTRCTGMPSRGLSRTSNQMNAEYPTSVALSFANPVNPKHANLATARVMSP